MTFSELKKKDIICIGDGRLVGRACDLAIDPASGQTLGLIVCAGSCGFLRGEKNQMEIPWRQITCIGDDVILVDFSGVRDGQYLYESGASSKDRFE